MQKLKKLKELNILNKSKQLAYFDYFVTFNHLISCILNFFINCCCFFFLYNQLCIQRRLKHFNIVIASFLSYYNSFSLQLYLTVFESKTKNKDWKRKPNQTTLINWAAQAKVVTNVVSLLSVLFAANNK